MLRYTMQKGNRANCVCDNANGKIKILDYGAGKGRILNGIEDNKEAFLEQIDYYAFDKSPKDREDCIYSISQLYENPEDRYFISEKELKSKHDEHSFDIIVMCNVLHEIDPIDWFDIFGNNGFITKTLKDAGILLVFHILPLYHNCQTFSLKVKFNLTLIFITKLKKFRNCFFDSFNKRIKRIGFKDKPR